LQDASLGFSEKAKGSLLHLVASYGATQAYLDRCRRWTGWFKLQWLPGPEVVGGSAVLWLGIVVKENTVKQTRR